MGIEPNDQPPAFPDPYRQSQGAYNQPPFPQQPQPFGPPDPFAQSGGYGQTAAFGPSGQSLPPGQTAPFGQPPFWGAPPSSQAGPSFMKRTPVYLTVVVVALVVGLVIGAALKSSGSGTGPEASSGGSATGAPASAPASGSAAPATIGSTLDLKDDIGESVAVTLVKVVYPAQGSDEFNTAFAGDVLVGVQFRIKNLAAKAYSDDPDVDAILIDASGQQYQTAVDTITSGPSLNSALVLGPGDTTLGYEVFEVPTGTKLGGVQYQLDLGEATGEWKIPG